MSAYIARVERVTTSLAELSVTDPLTRTSRILGSAELIEGVVLAPGDRVLTVDLTAGGVAIVRRLPPLP